MESNPIKTLNTTQQGDQHFYFSHRFHLLSTFLKENDSEYLSSKIKHFLQLITDEKMKKTLFYIIKQIVDFELFGNVIFTNNYSILMSEIQTEFMSTYDLIENLLSNLSNNESSLSVSVEETLLNLFSLSQINHLLFIFIFKNIQKNIPLNNSPEDKEKSVTLFLTIINKSKNFLSIFLKYISNCNNILRKKIYFSSYHLLEKKNFELTGTNFVLSNSEAVLDVLFFCLSYIFFPNEEITEEIEIFSNTLKMIFQIFFEYLLQNFKIYEQMITVKLKFLKIQEMLYFCKLIITYVNDCKFVTNEEELISEKPDFHLFYIAFYDFYFLFFCQLKMKIITVVESSLNLIFNYNENNQELTSSHNFVPIYLLNLCNEGLRDFICNHIVTNHISENNFEYINRNFWLKIIIDVYSYSEFYEFLLKTIYINFIEVDESLINRNERNLYSEILEYFKIKLYDISYNQIRKILLLNDCISMNTLLFLSNFLVKFKDKILKNLNSNIKELLHTIKSVLDLVKVRQGKFYFLICNNILTSINEVLEERIQKSKIRISIIPSCPLYFYEFEEIEKKPIIQIFKVDLDTTLNSNKNQVPDILKSPLMLDLESNKENVNILNFDYFQVPYNPPKERRSRMPKREKNEEEDSSKCTLKNKKRRKSRIHQDINFKTFDITEVMHSLGEVQRNLIKQSFHTSKLFSLACKNNVYKLRILNNQNFHFLTFNESKIDYCSFNCKEKLKNLGKIELISKLELEYLYVLGKPDSPLFQQTIKNSIPPIFQMQEAEISEICLINFKSSFSFFEEAEDGDYFRAVRRVKQLLGDKI
jgi:hypothetical protein